MTVRSNPFLYPERRHVRTEKPRAQTQYIRYKPYLRREFTAQCVYCRLPDALKGITAFGVDHYRPKSLFPADVLLYENLYYACNTCNSAKGGYWPGEAHRSKRIFVPNPCDYPMVSHLRYRGSKVEARSKAGEFTIDLLKLNDANSVEYREMYQGLIGDVRSVLATMRERLRLIERELDQSISAARRRQLEKAKNSLEREIDAAMGRLKALLCDI